MIMIAHITSNNEVIIFDPCGQVNFIESSTPANPMRFARFSGNIIDSPFRPSLAGPSVVAAVDKCIHRKHAELVEIQCKSETIVVGLGLATPANRVATCTVCACVCICQGKYRVSRVLGLQPLSVARYLVPKLVLDSRLRGFNRRMCNNHNVSKALGCDYQCHEPCANWKDLLDESGDGQNHPALDPTGSI